MSVFNKRNSIVKNLFIIVLACIFNPDSLTLGATTGSLLPISEADVSRSGSPVRIARGALVVEAERQVRRYTLPAGAVERSPMVCMLAGSFLDAPGVFGPLWVPLVL